MSISCPVCFQLVQPLLLPKWEHCGLVWKQGGRVQSWKRRLFAVYGKHVSYFKLAVKDSRGSDDADFLVLVERVHALQRDHAELVAICEQQGRAAARDSPLLGRVQSQLAQLTADLVPKGVIHLHGQVSVTLSSHPKFPSPRGPFLVKAAAQRNFLVVADSESDRNDWILTLRRAISRPPAVYCHQCRHLIELSMSNDAVFEGACIDVAGAPLGSLHRKGHAVDRKTFLPVTGGSSGSAGLSQSSYGGHYVLDNGSKSSSSSKRSTGSGGVRTLRRRGLTAGPSARKSRAHHLAYNALGEVVLPQHYQQQAQQRVDKKSSSSASEGFSVGGESASRRSAPAAAAAASEFLDGFLFAGSGQEYYVVLAAGHLGVYENSRAFGTKMAEALLHLDRLSCTASLLSTHRFEVRTPRGRLILDAPKAAAWVQAINKELLDIDDDGEDADDGRQPGGASGSRSGGARDRRSKRITLSVDPTGRPGDDDGRRAPVSGASAGGGSAHARALIARRSDYGADAMDRMVRCAPPPLAPGLVVLDLSAPLQCEVSAAQRLADAPPSLMPAGNVPVLDSVPCMAGTHLRAALLSGLGAGGGDADAAGDGAAPLADAGGQEMAHVLLSNVCAVGCAIDCSRPPPAAVQAAATAANPIDRRAVELPAAVLPGSVASLRGRAVLFHTGFRTQSTASTATDQTAFLSMEACDALIAAGVALVGTDGPALDRPSDWTRGTEPVVRRLLASGVLVVLRLANLSWLLEGSSVAPFMFHAAPVKLTGVRAVPVRAYAVQGLEAAASNAAAQAHIRSSVGIAPDREQTGAINGAEAATVVLKSRVKTVQKDSVELRVSLDPPEAEADGSDNEDDESVPPPPPIDDDSYETDDDESDDEPPPPPPPPLVD